MLLKYYSLLIKIPKGTLMKEILLQFNQLDLGVSLIRAVADENSVADCQNTQINNLGHQADNRFKMRILAAL